MALLGDWGTGLYGAVPCAESIRRDGGRFDLLMHLGDVYYSGTRREVRERFLNVRPFREDAVNRFINSNHEMYSGGHAYFRDTLPTFGQESSYFAHRGRTLGALRRHRSASGTLQEFVTRANI